MIILSGFFHTYVAVIHSKLCYFRASVKFWNLFKSETACVFIIIAKISTSYDINNIFVGLFAAFKVTQNILRTNQSACLSTENTRMRRADIIIAKSKEKQSYLRNQRSNEGQLQQKTKRQKQTSSPKATNSSPNSDTVMLSPIRESHHSCTQDDPVDISGVCSREVSAILSAGEIDDINKSLDCNLEEFVQVFTAVETSEQLATAADITGASASSTAQTTRETSSLTEENGLRKKARNGMANSQKWFRNSNKLQRLRGEAYCSSIKNEQGGFPEHAPRFMGPRCDSKRCERARSCHLLSDEDRQKIFSNFWSTMDWDQRKIYVVSLADMVDVKRKMGDSKRRQCTVKYHLKKGDAKLQVCKNMYLSTLCLGTWSHTFVLWLMSTTCSKRNILKTQPLGKFLLTNFIK